MSFFFFLHTAEGAPIGAIEPRCFPASSFRRMLCGRKFSVKYLEGCVCALELVEDAAELVDNLVLGRAAHSSDFIRFGFMSGPRSWT